VLVDVSTANFNIIVDIGLLVDGSGNGLTAADIFNIGLDHFNNSANAATYQSLSSWAQIQAYAQYDSSGANITGYMLETNQNIWPLAGEYDALTWIYAG
jgi:hypothetical protein